MRPDRLDRSSLPGRWWEAVRARLLDAATRGGSVQPNRRCALRDLVQSDRERRFSRSPISWTPLMVASFTRHRSWASCACFRTQEGECMVTGIVRGTARSGAARKRLVWRAGTSAAVLATALIASLALSASALAATTGVTQVSSDPFPAGSAPTAAHATEVEPDTFANGSTVVSAFQAGRVFNGGSSDIGFATSSDGGATWTHGFLPATDAASTPTGPFFSVSDPSVAYNARDGVWIISWLGAHFSGGGVVDVMVSRSADGGLTWSDPITVAASGVFYDKNWSVCDNTATSPHYGNCYTEFDNASSRDLEQMATSADGGLTWSAPMPTADNAHGL